MESRLTGKTPDKYAGLAMVLSYVIASTGLALFLGFIGYGLMVWLSK